MIITILILSTTVSSILILLQKTDFIGDYLNLVKNPTFRAKLLLNVYKKRHEYPNILQFWLVMFSARPKTSFFLKMVTCPYCIGFWLSLGISVVSGYWYLAGVTYFFGLVGYFIVDKILKDK